MTRQALYFAMSFVFAGLFSPQLCLASLILNGGFESPSVTPGTWQTFSTIPGWTLQSTTVFEIWNGFLSYTSAEGHQHLELDDDIITQVIATESGKAYSLRFSYAPRPNVVVNHILVAWDGQPVADISQTGVGATNLSWTTVSFNVSATASATELRLSGVGADPRVGMMIDDIQVTPVPSPASVWLVGPILLGLVAIRNTVIGGSSS